MTTFALIHGGGDSGWYWRLVEEELRGLGHETVAPDLPCDDDSATLDDYADTVVAATGDRRDVVVVGHSYGGFTAPLVAARLQADALVLVAAMIPAPGEKASDWWANTGYNEAVRAQAERDGGLTGNEDPLITFYHDVPPALAADAMAKQRGESPGAYSQPWPLDVWPEVPTNIVICTEDRFFPAKFMYRVAQDRLGVMPEEFSAGHCAALSRPHELARLLARYGILPQGGTHPRSNSR